mmetsp:Transcript_3248/g.9616  ORF Transcript_3248/g.9616 Transcript_3248/m.9616 type:complete len:420 (-) Transcript_3248:44-1303(-)
MRRTRAVAALTVLHTAAFQAPARRPRLALRSTIEDAAATTVVSLETIDVQNSAPAVVAATDPCSPPELICEVLDAEVSDAAAPGAVAVAAAPAPAREVVFMEALKETVDGEGLAGTVGDGIALVFGDTVRRRLWTRADYAHIHAVSGAYFLVLGFLWLIASHAQLFADPAVAQTWSLHGPLEASIVVMGAVNAVSAVPMARFSSNKMLDMTDLKANGFTFGGAGLTLMSCWMAWWFSGGYPSALLPAGPAFLVLWTAVCAGTTLNWEIMLQQNFEAAEAGAAKQKQIAGQGKLKKVGQDELAEKAILYRLASWPNLTQLLFLYSISLPDASAWWSTVTDQYPAQGVMLYHYGFASALGYALSMFSETLRDRKLVSLRVDLIILLIGVFMPMVSVGFDAAVLGDAVTVKPWEYWRQFQGW